MSYFAMQYRVLFHDTMAYGSHHYAVNFKFQNIARETILFDSRVREDGDWAEALKDIVMLTREAYSLNLTPVGLGGRVGILLSYEEPSRSTVRLCFRVVDEQGQPVSCGYQTMVVMDKNTHELVPAPLLLTQYLDAQNERNLLEKLTNPSFADRARGGSREVNKIFSDAVRGIGKKIAAAPRQAAYPRIVDDAQNEYPL